MVVHGVLYNFVKQDVDIEIDREIEISGNSLFR